MRPRLISLAIAAVAALVPSSQVLAAGEVGSAIIRDSVVPGDTLEVALSGVASPPAGSHYEGWLRAADGSERTDLGALPVGGDGTVNFKYVSPRSENLMGVNSVFEMTVEPDGDPDPNPSASVAYRGQLPDGMVPAVRELLFRWPESRFGTPAAEGLIEDAKLVDTTAAELLQAASTGDLGGAKLRAERIINTVEGQNGAKFGDHNGDGQAEGPGDGTGLLNYAWGSYWRARLSQDGAPGDEWVALYAGAVKGSAQQLVNQAGFLRDAGIAFESVTDQDEAMRQAQDLRTAAARLLAGFDADGDGTIYVLAGEGGAQQALENSQLMAAFRVSAVGG